jgi:hypothetical protein
MQEALSLEGSTLHGVVSTAMSVRNEQESSTAKIQA